MIKLRPGVGGRTGAARAMESGRADRRPPGRPSRAVSMPRFGAVTSWLRYNARLLALMIGLVLTVGVVVGQARQPAAADLSLRVSGNQLVDAAGEPVQLRGVNRSGAEYACVRGRAVFDGPSDAASVASMRRWNINAVRLPLNAHCWLGEDGIPPRFRGAPYRHAITEYVAVLNDAGIVVILDLHWTAPKGQAADKQQSMPDADHSIAFWKSVAETFVATPGVLFDLYNEPHGVSWPCWRDGCATQEGWRAAGMQDLVDAVRGAGAPQPVLVGGLQWASDLTGWLTHRPLDPLDQLVAAFHTYPFASCADRACWTREVTPVARVVPVITGEVGGDVGCERSRYVEAYVAWANAQSISWLAWTWNDWDCGSGRPLIRSYDGTPTNYGRSVREAILGE